MYWLQQAIEYDRRALVWCQQHQSLLPAARQISRSADGYLYAIAGALAAWLDETVLWLGLAVALVGERCCYWFLKNGIKRNRPPEAIPGFASAIPASDRFSFPSGHTSAAFLLTILTLLHYPPAAPILVPWACAVGWARVRLGVHFPADAVAGAILGSSWALLIAAAQPALNP